MREAGIGSAGPDDKVGIDIRTRLNLAMRAALKRRDSLAVAALRSALGAIGRNLIVCGRGCARDRSVVPGQPYNH
jgi:hypothetical protein